MRSEAGRESLPPASAQGLSIEAPDPAWPRAGPEPIVPASFQTSLLHGSGSWIPSISTGAIAGTVAVAVITWDMAHLLNRFSREPPLPKARKRCCKEIVVIEMPVELIDHYGTRRPL